MGDAPCELDCRRVLDVDDVVCGAGGLPEVEDGLVYARRGWTSARVKGRQKPGSRVAREVESMLIEVKSKWFKRRC